jgi:2-polyprenyl-3-methyl-5-hydroxy-6-metoxy-1,4-benzoquinol methylase
MTNHNDQIDDIRNSCPEYINGIFRQNDPWDHRSDDYDEHGFNVLVQMQREHFWYQGRHRFLAKTLNAELSRSEMRDGELRAIDLGGGCGGWLEYLNNKTNIRFEELALGDSSLKALTLAGPAVGSFASRYQVDLLDLKWNKRWDVIFLLDVLEHISEDEMVIEQVRNALAPGGLLFVTTPALKFFWSHNDVLAKHKRRYSCKDFAQLAQKSGMQLMRCQYFMFLLSPLLYLSRLRAPDLSLMTPEQLRAYIAKSHRTPAAPVNALLSNVFFLEALVSERIAFPWGTSILGVLKRV